MTAPGVVAREPARRARARTRDALAPLRTFTWRGRPSRLSATTVDGPAGGLSVDTLTNEFWTSRQRAGHSLHEVSYRACFKPELPRFFIDRLTTPGQVVYDPFMGRGTTVVEAALSGRLAIGCDLNPLSAVLAEPRLSPPTLAQVVERLDSLDLNRKSPELDPRDDLLVFYHPETLRQIGALRRYLLTRARDGRLDAVDRWIRMVAVNRLTGHSSGFFSVYTLPPNQALSADSQRRINARRGQAPPPRDVRGLILTKTRSLLRHCDEQTRRTLAQAGPYRLLTHAAASTPAIQDRSVDLIVTSPPFLDVVDYAADNWLRAWFCGIDAQALDLTVVRGLDEWRREMRATFQELARLLRPGGHVAFEVGEVRGGRVRLEEAVLPCGLAAGLDPQLVLINQQRFTKTANCWGIKNNQQGTNTNRIVLFRKPVRSLPRRVAAWTKVDAAPGATPTRRRA